MFLCYPKHPREDRKTVTMPIPEDQTRSYILRFWQSADHTSWRARLEPIGAHGEGRYFANLTSLLEFLQKQDEPAFIKLDDP